MGMCVSKMNRRNGRGREDPEEEEDPYSFDSISNNYEHVDDARDVDEYEDESEGMYENLPGVFAVNNPNGGPGYIRSASLSRDSAYSEATFSKSRDVSLSSLLRENSGDVTDLAVTDDGTPSSDCSIPRRRPSSHKNQSFNGSLNYSTYRSLPFTKCRRTNTWSKGKISTVEIAYMVDAFLPLLQDSIRVMDVVVHIHFIEDIATFLNKDKDSPREAVVMLIERIKMSDEKGKWQTFLEALKSGGYQYLNDLLQGETEKDNTIPRRLLRLFTPQLMNRMDPQQFLDQLYETGVLDDADKEQIQREEANRGAMAASLMLLECVPRKHPDWYEIFLDVLKKCGLGDMVDDFGTEHSHCTPVPGTISTTSSEDSYITPVPDTEYIPYTDRCMTMIGDSSCPHCGHTRSQSCVSKDDNGNFSKSSVEDFDLTKKRKERDSVKKQVQNAKEMKNLNKEIEVLKKELLALQNDEETESQEPTSNREKIREVEARSTQTDEATLLLSEIHRLVLELTAKEGSSMRGQKMPDPGVQRDTLDSEQELYAQNTPLPHLAQLFNVRQRAYTYAPIGHKIHLPVGMDSGVYSEYLSMISNS